MDYRRVSIVAAFLGLSTPLVSQAAPHDAALNACVRAFASSVRPGAALANVKVHYVPRPGTSLISDYFSREYSFFLQAKGASTGTIAVATCSANANGTVVSLQPVRPGEDKTLAAKL